MLPIYCPVIYEQPPTPCIESLPIYEWEYNWISRMVHSLLLFNGAL